MTKGRKREKLRDELLGLDLSSHIVQVVSNPFIFSCPDYENKENDLQFRVICGVLDLLGQRELVTAHAGTDCIHARHAVEIEALFCYEINRDSNFEIFV